MTADDGYRLAAALHRQAMEAVGAGELPRAIELLHEAVEVQPSIAAFRVNFGVLLNLSGRSVEAIEQFRRAIELTPDEPLIYNNLSNALTAAGQIDAAIDAANRSLELNPDQAEAFNALGNALKEQGRVTEAMEAYGRGAALGPAFASAFGAGQGQLASNRLYAAHFVDGLTPSDLLKMHQQWAADLPRFEPAPIRKRVMSKLDRLRIGYVSPDFKDHPVGRFILPIIRAHDRSQFEVFCYSGAAVADEFTGKIRAAAERWRAVLSLDDEQLADAIRADGIDILVDLSLHMRGNRLRTFARKPAPVQVTYLGYASTTALASIDFRLTDPYLDPHGPSRDSLYVEQSIRLPRTYWCYEPPIAPPPAPSPARTPGDFTFGCLNNFCKVTDHTLLLWRSIFRQLPAARIILHTPEGLHRQRVIERLRISSDRIQFVPRLPHNEYLQLHHEIDIALDPTPCTGGTTTCDALWMGVPVVSLAGETAVARSGLSILSNVGLADCVADSGERYAAIAVALAYDPARLGHLRRSLRDQMQASPLMDITRFIADLEAAYRDMWSRS